MNKLEICIFILALYLLLKNIKTTAVVEKMSNTDAINKIINDKYKINNIREFKKEYDNLKEGKTFNNLVVEGKLQINNNFNQLPKGCIVPYHGTEVPKGWALCNGSNGTPDLRSRFIIGSGQGEGLSSYEQSGTGGTEKVGLTVEQMPEHTHSSDETGKTSKGKHGVHHGYSGGQFCFRDAWDRCYRKQTFYRGGHDPPKNETTFKYNMAGKHSHGGKTSATGNSLAHNNMPPYLVLTFIMKIEE